MAATGQRGLAALLGAGNARLTGAGGAPARSLPLTAAYESPVAPSIEKMSPVSVLCFLLFHLLIPSPAQADGDITIGSSLTAKKDNSSWLSPSGDFAFGFRTLPANPDNHGEVFLLSIWYNKIPSRTIVWFANGDHPAPENSKLEFTSDLGLVLIDPRGERLWISENIVGTISHATINDTGNFIILGSNLEKLWESFEDPDDTLLPSQTLGKNKSLSSRQSEGSFSRGKFQLRMLDSGDLVLNTINLPSSYANKPYYSTKTARNSNTSSPGKKSCSTIQLPFVLRENDDKVYLSQVKVPSASDFYHRITLNFDGVLTQYVHPKNSNSNGTWTSLWSEPENICTAVLAPRGSGVCGYNSICSLGNNNRPKCGCPDKYTLLDPNDEYGSCIPNFTLSCEEDEKKLKQGSVEDLYTFVELEHMGWLMSDYALLKPFSEDECRNSCLHDCMRAAAGFRDGNSCWKKKLPLSNGRVDPKLKGNRISAIRTSASVNFLLITWGIFFVYRKKLKNISTKENFVESNLRYFTYQELFRATDGFKEEIGRGSFGIVYKGVMSNDAPIAVKKLASGMQNKERELRTEVDVIGQTFHKNLVRLLGFCDEGQERLLVYEFLSNGTLSSLLFSGESKPSWIQRCHIASGIARGLLYLHEERTTQIIHCDIKPQNILLDDYYNARISDFGLAKLLKMSQSHTQTNIRGTRGYIAPEWFRNLPISVKVDVYSYGVLLLEIICCRRRCGTEVSRESEGGLLTHWAYDCFMHGRLDALVEGDTEGLSNRVKLKNLVMITLWCIQEDPSLRPTMKKVTQMLEGAVEVPVPPCPFPLNRSTSSFLQPN
ncbi:G-type lectin S-receptor-like serine/threonine-protein kinase LECRK2 [Eucalyptus grandis]|uniref:G-type lectin S-receptor-like serine/threonine-protein kinase LECRK2 n=1 Tax=Eucalyptus grandis TaxID=71139 RepID=UPI00192EFDEA|nr:G-type lectin S-receptor-like serine/threonine-protein kinase LECRK2 [Eucalyptus grandis]